MLATDSRRCFASNAARPPAASPTEEVEPDRLRRSLGRPGALYNACRGSDRCGGSTSGGPTQLSSVPGTPSSLEPAGRRVDRSRAYPWGSSTCSTLSVAPPRTPPPSRRQVVSGSRAPRRGSSACGGSPAPTAVGPAPNTRRRAIGPASQRSVGGEGAQVGDRLVHVHAVLTAQQTENRFLEGGRRQLGTRRLPCSCRRRQWGPAREVAPPRPRRVTRGCGPRKLGSELIRSRPSSRDHREDHDTTGVPSPSASPLAGLWPHARDAARRKAEEPDQRNRRIARRPGPPSICGQECARVEEDN